MNFRGNRWFTIVLILIFGLASCAINNKLVIENKEGHSNIFSIKGHQLSFPAESEVQFVPMYGASWVLFGELATIVSNVVADLDSNSGVIVTVGQDSQIQTQDITIKYTDSMTDGSHTHLSLSLDMTMNIIQNGMLIATCQIPTVYPKLDSSVYHGLFAGREKMKTMILPAYEELISKALTEALVTGFKCLSEKTK